MNKIFRLSIILAILAFFLPIIEINYPLREEQMNSNSNILTSELISIKISNNLNPINPIVISNDTDFENQALLYGWQGYGDEFFPYIISNYIVDNKTSVGIQISSVNAYFKIENIVVNNSLGAGILISSSMHGTIKDCVIANITDDAGTRNGIFITDSDFMSISNTTLVNNTVGINISNSPNMNILNNTVYLSSLIGIDLEIIGFPADNNFIGWNSVSLSGTGIKISSSTGSNNTVDNNIAYENDIGFEISKFPKVTNNTAYKNNLYGFLFNTADYSIVHNNTAMENGQYGFYIKFTSYLEFYKNFSTEHINGDGLLIEYSSNINVTKNKFTSNHLGIQIFVGNSNLYVQKNLFEGNYWGIDIFNCPYTAITQNVFYNNTDSAIRVLHSYFDYIALNNFSYNNNLGLYFNAAAYNNTITTNYFINNTVNAQDDSSSPNFWQGNYFSDYADEPFYLISGTASAIDNIPRAIDSDGDGMPDYFEKKYNFDVFVNDSYLDSDNDGLTNFQEYIYGSNPSIPQNFTTSIQTTIISQTTTQISTTTEVIPTTEVVTITETPTIITTSINSTFTTVNTTQTTLITFIFRSSTSNSNSIITSNSVPGYQLLIVCLTISVVVNISARRRKK
jgi:parallel beta-helix repeat protein